MRDNRTVITLLLTGFILTCCFYFLIMRRYDPTAGVDAKMYYTGARILLRGGDPYSWTALQNMSRSIDPYGLPVGDRTQCQVNAPFALLASIPIAFLPWRLVFLLHVAINAFCIPIVVLLSWRLFRPSLRSNDHNAASMEIYGYGSGDKLSVSLLIGLSVLIAVFPPVWRAVYVGQLTMAILAVILCMALAMEKRRYWLLGSLALISLFKVTCTLPVIAYFFIQNRVKTSSSDQRSFIQPHRITIIVSLALFFLINLTLTWQIGPQKVRAGLTQSYQASFTNLGPNDPYGIGKDARIDIESILACIVARPNMNAAKILVCLLLFAPLGWITYKSIKEDDGVSPRILAYWLLFTLLIMYHRPYDSILAIPLLYVIYDDYKNGTKAGACWKLFALLFCCLTMGNHNLQMYLFSHGLLKWDIVLITRSSSILLLYLAAVLPELSRLQRLRKDDTITVENRVNQ